MRKYVADHSTTANYLERGRHPRDTRDVVQLRSDLINPNTWGFQPDSEEFSGYFNDKVYIVMLVAVIEDTPQNNGVYLFVGNYGTPYDPADYWFDLRYWKKLAFAVDVDDETTNWIPSTDPDTVHVKRISGGQFGTNQDSTADLDNSEYLNNNKI